MTDENPSSAPPSGLKGQTLWHLAPLAAMALAVLSATLRIIGTYSELSQTYDEPLHLACGMEYLARGTYTYEPQHPPLGRIASAIIPYLAGSTAKMLPTMQAEGNAILGAGAAYWDRLAQSRMGTLPFFWLTCGAIYYSAMMLGGPAAGWWAVLAATSQPAILGHSGLATLDVGLGSWVLSAFALFLRRLRGRTDWLWWTSLAVVLAGGVLTKFLFLPAIALIALGYFLVSAGRLHLRESSQAWRRGAKHLIYCIGLTSILIWGGYKFSFGPVGDRTFVPGPGTLENVARVVGSESMARRLFQVGVPAPELFRGLIQFSAHARRGHVSYFLGESGEQGWWSYYPVLLLVKTPPGLIGLSVLGIGILGIRRRGARFSLLVGSCFLVFLACSRVNLGLRHALCVVGSLAILAGCGSAWLVMAWNWSRILACVVLWVGTGVSLHRTHPDYMSYFNWLAGGDPSRITVESDLDWGQDVGRLATWLRRHGNTSSVHTALFTSGDIAAVGVERAVPADPHKENEGLTAVSIRFLRMPVGGGTEQVDSPIRPFRWLEGRNPRAKIGKSILVY